MSEPMGQPNNRILMIDDTPAIHEDFRKILIPDEDVSAMLEIEAEFFGDSLTAVRAAKFEIDSAYQGQEGLELAKKALEEERPYSLAFVDVRMPPGWDGVETISQIWKVCPDLQVVICTAYSDYSWQDFVGQLGNTENLVILKKPFDNVEVLQLAHALTKKWSLTLQARNRMVELDQMVNERTGQLQQEIAERQKLNDQLIRSQERFSKAFHATPLPMAIQSLDNGTFVDVNGAFLRTLGYESDQLIGQTAINLGIWQNPEECAQILQQLKSDQPIRNQPCQFKTRLGRIRQVFVSVEQLSLGGEPNLLLIAEDVSERLSLEKRLQEAQKMQAVGQLAAGVAHDFNNLLTIIQGHASIRLATANLDRQMTESLLQMANAAERGGSLTRQLLAFSSRQVVQPKLLDFNSVVDRLQPLLSRAIGERITLEWDTAGQLSSVQADECGIEQVAMNLVVNARDAMPDGGKIIIKTDEVTIDADYVTRNPDAREGTFVRLSVIDQGCGIQPDIIEHIFEPFFTTKGVGEGTGLGLATVFGIAQQHKGWTEVSSNVDKGTTFRVFFPSSGEHVNTPDSSPKITSEPAKGSENVLLAEDEAVLRELMREVLRSNGYNVVEAEDGQHARELWHKHEGQFDMLVTDVVMPNVTGIELAKSLREANPKLPVIYTSGYNSEMAGKEFSPDEAMAFLQKPYKPGDLLQTMRDLLDEGEPPIDVIPPNHEPQ